MHLHDNTNCNRAFEIKKLLSCRRGDVESNGGLEKTRTSDLFRVKEAL